MEITEVPKPQEMMRVKTQKQNRKKDSSIFLSWNRGREGTTNVGLLSSLTNISVKYCLFWLFFCFLRRGLTM
jgi:hypothetical protein